MFTVDGCFEYDLNHPFPFYSVMHFATQKAVPRGWHKRLPDSSFRISEFGAISISVTVFGEIGVVGCSLRWK